MALALTLGVIGPSDVNRLRRELSGLDNFFIQAAARRAGTTITPPATTQQLDELAKVNKLNLLQKTDRQKLAKQLDEILTKAPKLKISFAVDPPPKVVETILNWLRANLDPRILLSVGLQPNIGAGCVLRTPNREFDMSMRQHMVESRPYLAQLIEDAARKTAVAQSQDAATVQGQVAATMAGPAQPPSAVPAQPTVPPAPAQTPRPPAPQPPPTGANQ